SGDMKGSIIADTTACEEARRLLDSFTKADQQAALFKKQHTLATIMGDPCANQLELLTDLATKKCEQEKSAYSEHTTEHGCGSSSHSKSTIQTVSAEG